MNLLRLVASLVVLTGGTRGESTVSRRETVLERLARVERASRGITVDGKADDWAEIPSFKADSTEPNKRRWADIDPSKRIVSMAIAPRANDLLILVRTASRPSRDDQVFWFDVDFVGQQWNDYRVGIGTGPIHTLWVYSDERTRTGKQIDGLSVAIDEAVEIKIPYDALSRQMLPSMAVALAGPNARSYVRVTPFTYDSASDVGLDHGPSAASYRLLAIPPALGSAPAAARRQSTSASAASLRQSVLMAPPPYGSFLEILWEESSHVPPKRARRTESRR